MKLIKILGTSSAIALLGLAACTVPAPAPLCDRENVEWDKYDTGELPMACLPPPTIVFLPPTEGNDREPPTHEPPTHEPPTHEPPTHEPEPEPREKRNNGLGDGDQRAPGNSLSHNKAENERGNPGHKSGKPQNSN